MKKKNYIMLLICCVLITQAINAQNFMWSKQIGGASIELNPNLCADANGDIYVSGSYQSNPCYFDMDSLTKNGFLDFFLTKYNSSGVLQWLKHFGSNLDPGPLGGEGIRNIKYDKYSNSVFISGVLYDMLVFDSDTLTSSNGRAFIAKLDLNGNFTWYKQTGININGGFISFDVDSLGYIYAEIAVRSSGMLDTIVVTPGIYLAKYNANGSIIWLSKKFNYNASSTDFDAELYRVKLKNDKIFAVGNTWVDSLTIDTITFHSNFPNGQSVIACFDTSGTALWFKPCAGITIAATYGLDVDDNNNSYITGNFSQTAIFDNDTLTNSNYADLFIAKYSSSGHCIWAQQANSTVSASGFDLALSSDAGVYITGTFTGTSTFGTYNVTSTPIRDMFVARYDTSGSCIGVRNLGEAYGYSIACNNSGDFFCTGYLYTTLTFPSNPTLTSYGSNDFYIAKSAAITGIGGLERTSSNQLIIYANPTKGTCNVTIPDEFLHEKNLTLQIFDNTGKLLQQTKVEMQQDKIKLNLQEEAKGIYNVTLSNGKKNYNGKVVFE